MSDFLHTIAAVHLNTINVAMRCPMVAIWQRDLGDAPIYLPLDTAGAIRAWVATSPGFLLAGHILIALDTIVRIDRWYDHALPVLHVHVEGQSMPFVFPYESAAAEMVRTAWRAYGLASTPRSA
jgi:hypothetical protein